MITLKEIKHQYPETYMPFAKFLHTRLTKEEYSKFTTWHPYVHYMYLLTFLKSTGFDPLAQFEGYHALEIKASPVQAIEEVIRNGLLNLSNKLDKTPF